MPAARPSFHRLDEKMASGKTPVIMRVATGS
jgi:hypothetical protein